MDPAACLDNQSASRIPSNPNVSCDEVTSLSGEVSSEVGIGTPLPVSIQIPHSAHEALLQDDLVSIAAPPAQIVSPQVAHLSPVKYIISIWESNLGRSWKTSHSQLLQESGCQDEFFL